MRIKLLPVFIVCLILSLTVVSCLDGDDEITYTTNATITRFTLNDIETLKTEGEGDDLDTLYLFTVTGSNYSFAIDQLNGKIYNVDSLPYRTDVTKVSFSPTYYGYGLSYKKMGEDGNMKDTVWIGTDSLDFTNPIDFTVYTYNPAYPDATITKDYQIDIRVHQVNPDTLMWNSYSGFPGDLFNEEQKAVMYNEEIYVYGNSGTQTYLVITDPTENYGWGEPVAITGIESGGVVDCNSVILFKSKLYLIAKFENNDNRVYSSSDGVEWIPEVDESLAIINADILVAAFSGKLIAVRGDTFIQATVGPDNNIVWEETINPVPDNFPVGRISSVRKNLDTNPEIERIVLVGEESVVADTTAVVWSILSTEDTWVSFTPVEEYDCPNLKNLSIIEYDDMFMAFGGDLNFNGKVIEPFDAFYASADWGWSWNRFEKNLTFPSVFKNLGAHRSYSYIVDGSNFIWIMWSGEDRYYKGRINRLAD